MPRIAAVWLLIAGASVAQEDVAGVSEALEAVRSRVAELQRTLTRQRESESAAVAALARSERAIGAAVGERASIGARIDEERGRLAALEKEARRVEQALAGQRERLAAQLRAAYLLSREHRLKLWLDQENPAAVGRTLGYFTFLRSARLATMEALRADLARLHEVRARIDASLARLAGLAAEAREAEAEARARREDRAAALALVRDELAASGAELAALRARQEELAMLLEALQAAFADIPDALAGQPFEALRGRLKWPVDRPFLRRPGQPKDGGLETRGALLRAERGLAVRAIAAGRVAYADWLRGFGLLTIIDHGDGYLSLYAFKETLATEVGDWVGPGETIGTAGDTGGRGAVAVYFELRRSGEPIDPTPWFAGTPG